MAFSAFVKPSAVAVSFALARGSSPSRVVGIEVFFPDLGAPRLESLGFLRYSGEPSPGDRGTAATVPPSDHHQ